MIGDLKKSKIDWEQIKRCVPPNAAFKRQIKENKKEKLSS